MCVIVSLVPAEVKTKAESVLGTEFKKVLSTVSNVHTAFT